MPDAERSMARTCARYVQDVVRPEGLVHGRDRLAAGLEDLYVRRLRLPMAQARVEALRGVLEDPDAVLIEMAHDGQLPHLGIVRLVLKARQIAAEAPKGLALYLVGDHYSADMRPENLYLGLPLRGVDADHAKNPLTVPVGRKFRHVPFKWLPPPTPAALDELERRADAWVINNTTAAGKSAPLPSVRARLRAQFDLLRESSKWTATFGDWLIRVQALWFDALFDGPPERLAILPMSEIAAWVPEALHDLAAREEELSRIKAEVSAGQRERGEVPYAGDHHLLGSFWVYCPTCRRRHRGRREARAYVARCPSCGQRIDARWPEDRDRIMPDIVAYEMALFHVGIAGWVVGSKAPYHPVIERAYRDMYGREMPPKFLLASVPRFTGIGEPPSGHTRARLFRVLLEGAPRKVREALEGPWADHPDLRSDAL